jgi:hypothetical protein
LLDQFRVVHRALRGESYVGEAPEICGVRGWHGFYGVTVKHLNMVFLGTPELGVRNLVELEEPDFEGPGLPGIV